MVAIVLCFPTIRGVRPMSNLLIQHGEWVVVCDGAKALVLENTGDAKFPNLKTLEVFEQKDLATHELGDDVPGRAMSPAGTRRSAIEQTDWHDQAERAFLVQLVKHLDAAITAGKTKSLIVVAKSFCSNTSRVLRLGNLASPVFSSTSALAPSHTTTHSPCWINKPDMNRPPQLARHPRTAATIAFCSGSNAWARDFVAKGLRQLVPSSNRRAMT